MSQRLPFETQAFLQSSKLLNHYLWTMPEELMGYITQWVPYVHGVRIKAFHDVKLFDGTVVEHLWPNGDEFMGSSRHLDETVEFIRLSTKENEY